MIGIINLMALYFQVNFILLHIILKLYKYNISQETSLLENSF